MRSASALLPKRARHWACCKRARVSSGAGEAAKSSARVLREAPRSGQITLGFERKDQVETGQEMMRFQGEGLPVSRDGCGIVSKEETDVTEIGEKWAHWPGADQFFEERLSTIQISEDCLQCRQMFLDPLVVGSGLQENLKSPAGTFAGAQAKLQSH